MTWRPRYSLRTLAIFTLLATSGVGLWLHWEPWVIEKEFDPDNAKDWCRDVSPNGTTVMSIGGRDDSLVRVCENRRNGRVLAGFKFPKGHEVLDSTFSPDGSRIMAESVVYAPSHHSIREVVRRDTRIYRRRRPEWWWGIFWLWEFWLTVAFAGLFVWSVVRDRRALRGKDHG